MPRFYLKTALAAVGLVAIALAALVGANAWWQMAVQAGLAVLLASSLLIAWLRPDSLFWRGFASFAWAYALFRNVGRGVDLIAFTISAHEAGRSDLPAEIKTRVQFSDIASDLALGAIGLAGGLIAAALAGVANDALPRTGRTAPSPRWAGAACVCLAALAVGLAALVFGSELGQSGFRSAVALLAGAAVLLAWTKRGPFWTGVVSFGAAYLFLIRAYALDWLALVDGWAAARLGLVVTPFLEHVLASNVRAEILLDLLQVLVALAGGAAATAAGVMSRRKKRASSVAPPKIAPHLPGRSPDATGQ